MTTHVTTRIVNGELHVTLGRTRYASLLWAVAFGGMSTYLFKTYPPPHSKGPLLFLLIYFSAMFCLLNMGLWLQSLFRTEFVISLSKHFLRRRCRWILPLRWRKFRLDPDGQPLLNRWPIGPTREVKNKTTLMIGTGVPVEFGVCIPLESASYFHIGGFRDFSQAKALGEACADYLKKPLWLCFPEEGAENRLLPTPLALAGDLDPELAVVESPPPSNMLSTVELSDGSLTVTIPRKPSEVVFVLLVGVVLLLLVSAGVMLVDGLQTNAKDTLVVLFLTCLSSVVFAGPFVVLFAVDRDSKRKYPYEIVVGPGVFRWRIKRGKRPRFHVLKADVYIRRPAFHGCTGLTVSGRKSAKRRWFHSPSQRTFGEHLSRKEVNYLHRLIVQTFTAGGAAEIGEDSDGKDEDWES